MLFPLLLACLETGLNPATDEPAPGSTAESTDSVPTDTAPIPEDTAGTTTGTTVPDTAPDLVVSPDPITFAADQTDPIPVTLSNIGNGPLEVFDVLLQGADAARFAHTGGAVLLDPGASAAFDLFFDPDACQGFGADLVVYSDDPDEIQVVVDVVAEEPTSCGPEDLWCPTGLDTVLRVDQATNTLLSTISLPAGVTASSGVAVDDVSAWIAGSSSDASGLAQIDKLTEAVTWHGFGGGITAVTLDETHVWAGSGEDRTLYRLDKLTGSVEDQLALPEGTIQGLDVAGDHLWVTIFQSGTEYPYEGRLAKLDKTTLAELGSVTFEGYPDVYIGSTTLAHYPTGVLAWGDHVWVAVSNEDLVWQLDADTLALVTLVDATSRPVALTRDASHLYTGHKHGAATAKIEPDGTVVSATPVSEYLNNVSVGVDHLWLVQQQGGLARLDKGSMAVLESYQTYGETWHHDVHVLGDMTGHVYWERYLRE